MLGFLLIFFSLLVFITIHIAHRLYFGKIVFQTPLDGYLLDIRSKEKTSREREICVAIKKLDQRLDRAGISSSSVTDHLEIVLSDKNASLSYFDLRFLRKSYIIYLNVNSEDMVEDLFESYKQLL